MRRGNVYFEVERYEEAITDYTKALEIDPGLHRIYYKRGKAFCETGEFKRGISDIKFAKDNILRRKLKRVDLKKALAVCDKGMHAKEKSTAQKSEEEEKEVVQLLEVKKDEKLSANLHDEVSKGDLKQIKELIIRGVDVNEKDSNGYTPLHIAARNGNVEIARYLIAKGAIINVKSENEKTPLHYAAQYGHLSAVKLLVEKGAIVDARDEEWQTPMAIAVKGSHMDVVNYFFNHGADLNVKDKEGEPLFNHFFFFNK